MIGRITLIGGAVLALAGAALLARRAGDDEPAPEDDRWLTVTVAASREEVAPNGAPPHPLAELGDRVEWRLEPAPGDRGIELSARPRAGFAGELRELAHGRDPRETVRIAVRESKQLIEAGEVLRIDPRPSGARPQTPAGAIVDTVVRRSHGEGVL
ncbi:hypothetical protein ACFFGH_10375 [Lysobacter korlensis]|uniref:Flp pilus assembly protein CpaB n=1 Tax=Lysobacter korlensis TaxID=553636 RepID=A0ABV6RMN3_9GAMM